MPRCWWMLHQKVYKLNTVEHCCIPVANYSTYVVSWKLLYTSVILSSCKVKSWVKCPWINAWKRAWICFISYGNTLNTFDAVDTRTEGIFKAKVPLLATAVQFFVVCSLTECPRCHFENSFVVGLTGVIEHWQGPHRFTSAWLSSPVSLVARVHIVSLIVWCFYSHEHPKLAKC